MGRLSTQRWGLILLTSALLLSAPSGAAPGWPKCDSPQGEAVQPKPRLEIYGTVMLDSAYDDSPVNPGNFARWVESESVLDGDSQYSMTANPTRVGLTINAPPEDRMEVTGRLEVDFFGGGPENKSRPMLRHAYVSFAWPASGLSVVAGQTWDIISPLNVPTVNYSVGWWQGNIGYRRAQIRVTKALELSRNTELEIQLGPTRTIGDSGFAAGTIDPGTDAAVPTVQSRFALTFPGFGGRKSAIGISGHWGKEDRHVFDSMGTIIGHQEIDTWSTNIDVRVPVTEALLIQAEWFRGENLAAYLGGVGQPGEIVASGGWIAASIEIGTEWEVHFGAGVDDPEDTDLVAPEARAKNRMAFANVRHRLTRGLTVALEVMHLQTDYLGLVEGDALREQLSIKYKF